MAHGNRACRPALATGCPVCRTTGGLLLATARATLLERRPGWGGTGATGDSATRIGTRDAKREGVIEGDGDQLVPRQQRGVDERERSVPARLDRCDEPGQTGELQAQFQVQFAMEAPGLRAGRVVLASTLGFTLWLDSLE